MTRLVGVAFLAASSMFGVLAHADEVRLKDGRTLIGEAKTVGQTVVVETRGGTVRVAVSDVARIRTTEDLRQALADMAARAPQTAYGQLQLARTARDWGLDDELWKHLDAGLEACQRTPHLRNQLRAFLAELEPEVLPHRWRDVDTDTRVRELLHRLRDRRVTPAKTAVVIELLAREPGADGVLRQRARDAGLPAQRIAAIAALSLRPAEDNDRFVYRTPIVDGSDTVRRETAGLIARQGQAREAVRYLAPGLLHDHPIVRMRTATAYANLGDDFAVDLLVAAGPLAGTAQAASAGAVRGNVAFLNQQSYIRDFEVEVAQASFIADPKVAVLQDGAVLDATVHAVVTHRTEIVDAYRKAITHLAGNDPGRDAGEWSSWWSSRRPAHAEVVAPESARPAAAGTPAAPPVAVKRQPPAANDCDPAVARELNEGVPPIPKLLRRQSAVQLDRDIRNPQARSPANGPLPGGRPSHQPSPVPVPLIPARPLGPMTTPVRR